MGKSKTNTKRISYSAPNKNFSKSQCFVTYREFKLTKTCRFQRQQCTVFLWKEPLQLTWKLILLLFGTLLWIGMVLLQALHSYEELRNPASDKFCFCFDFEVWVLMRHYRWNWFTSIFCSVTLLWINLRLVLISLFIRW